MKKLLFGAAGILFGLALVFSITAPVQAAALTSAQIQAIVGLLQSFGADQSVINNVNAVLGGSSSGSQSCSTFADLTYGDFDDSPGGRVSQLQTWLGISSNTFGFGTYGNKTRTAWQSRCGGGTSKATFSASPTSGAAPLNVTFTSNNTGTIDFGDGSNGQMQSCLQTQSYPSQTRCTSSHTYYSAGTYTSTLSTHVGGPYGPEQQIGTATITVTDRGTIGGVPSINGLDAPTSLSVGQTGTWTVRASAPSGTQLRYSVLWGDETPIPTLPMANTSGTIVNVSGSFTHTYQTPGTYKPWFNVYNDSGSAQTSASVVVSNNTQAVTFSASPTSGAAPLAVRFTATGLDTSGSYSVDFDDGTSGSGSCSITSTSVCTQSTSYFNHTYSSAGTYTAKLIYQPSYYCPPGAYCTMMMPAPKTVGTATVTVSGGTTNGITFSASPTSGFAPLGVVFTTNVSGPLSLIDFGDGTSGKVSSDCATSLGGSANCNTGSYFASHSYQYAGTYTATIKRIIGVREIFGGGDTNIYETMGTVTITVMTGWL